MNDTTTPLRDPAFMQAFLDVVIPPSADGKLPGAGSLGVAEDIAGRIEPDPMLGAAVQAGLRAVQDAAIARDPAGLAALAPAARADVVASVQASHPALMIGISVHLYPMYYQHPRVLAGLGEPGRTPFPEGFDLEPTDPALMRTLLARRLSAPSGG